MKHRLEIKPQVKLSLTDDELCIDIIIDGKIYDFFDLKLAGLEVDTLLASILSAKEHALLTYEALNKY